GRGRVLRREEILDPSLCRRPLEIRALIAVRAHRDAVLADLGEDLEFVCDVATHRPRVGLDAYRIEAHALEGTLIRPMLGGVAPFETRLVDIEAVRVFHDELAHAQK